MGQELPVHPKRKGENKGREIKKRCSTSTVRWRCGAAGGRSTWKRTVCFSIVFVCSCFPPLIAPVMRSSTHLSPVSEHLALDTQWGLLSKWSTPQPHAMPNILSKLRVQRRDGWHAAQCGLPVASLIPPWMKGDEFGKMEHPVFPLEAEEMRLREVSQSQSSTDPVNHGQRGSNERKRKRWAKVLTRPSYQYGLWRVSVRQICAVVHKPIFEQE